MTALGALKSGKGAQSDELIDTSPIHQKVYRRLRVRIMQGHYKPGEVLSIRKVSAELGVSSLPVRDALGRLVTERALEMPHARSFRVVNLTDEEFRNLCDLRIVVEGYAISRAAPLVTDADLKVLRDMDREVMAAIARKDLARAFELNQQFMFKLYMSGGDNSEVVPHIELLWLRSGPFVSMRIEKMTELVAQNRASLTHHREILAALERRDAIGAKRAITQEITDTYELHVQRDAISEFV